MIWRNRKVLRGHTTCTVGSWTVKGIRTEIRVGEMSQMLRVLAALTKDLGSDLSIHNGRLTTAYHSGSRGSDIIFGQKEKKENTTEGYLEQRRELSCSVSK